MNIILNGQTLQYPLTGIGWYTQYLSQGLQAHPLIKQLVCWPTVSEYHDEIDQKKFLFQFQSRCKKFVKLFPGTYAALNYTRDILFKKKTRHLTDKNFIYHEPCYVLRPYPGPKICTVHDLSHIRYPESHPKSRVKFLLRYLPASINSADHVITGSYFIRNEIISHFKLSPNKITSIYHGVSPMFRVREFNELKWVLARYGLAGKSYLLSVGTLEPRKNLERLILAFMQLSERQRKQYPLVLVGVKGWNTYRLEKLIYPLIQKGQLYCLGYVRALDLPYLYSGAYGFIYLSVYEGFGLPLLEAMASGIPTLAANIAATPEVVDNAALQVNPFDVPSITDKLNQLLNDLSLRSRLKQQGPIQASQFSWDACLERTVAVYQQVLNLHQ